MKVSVLNLAAPLRQLAYLCALLVAVTFSVPAMAQAEHGAGPSKGCPTASKVGDLATCGLSVTNTDEFGDVILVDEIWDTVNAPVPFRVPAVGNLPIIAVSEGVTCEPAPIDADLAPLGLVLPCTIPGLAEPGGSKLSILVRSQYTVPVGATDPLIDQGNYIVRDGCDEQPVGCNPNPQQQQFGASVSLFVPSIDVTKTGPDSAKVGDEITYTIGFTDTTTGTGFPGFENCTGNDALLGGDLGVFTAGVTRDFLYTVQVGDPDPLLNTATITCDVVGFDNVVENSDSHNVDLIDPSIALAKACTPNPVEVGGTIEWAITVNNTGDTDLICLVNDPTAGFVDEPVTVAVGGSEVLNASRIVGERDAPSISNTATVSCPVLGFDNEITDSVTAECAVPMDNEAIPTLSDGARWLLVLMILGAGLLLMNRYSPQLRK
jgi:hypothetical protein